MSNDCPTCDCPSSLDFNTQLGLLVVSVALNLISGVILSKKLTLRCWKCALSIRTSKGGSPDTPMSVTSDTRGASADKLQPVTSDTRAPSAEQLHELEKIIVVDDQK